MWKEIILLVMFSGLSFVDASALTENSFKFTKTYQTSAGLVTFHHEQHAFGRVQDCAFCHSALETFGGEMNELFAHNFCQACHESNEGPTDCKGCHK